MEVRHGVAAVVADVAHEAVAAVGQALGRRHLLGQEVHRRQILGVLGLQLVGVGDVRARDDEHVCRHRRVDVAEGVGALALGHLRAGDVAGQDLAEEAVVGHGTEGSVRAVATAGDPEGGDADRFVSALERLVADAAAAEAARERSQERHLRDVAEAEATFVGVAVDLAERRAAVVVRTVTGRTHRGQVLAVGRDVVVVRDGDRPPALLAIGGITSIRGLGATHVGVRRDTAGARPAPLDVSFAGLVSRLGAERPRVHVVVPGDDPVIGEVRAVGADVLTVRLDHEGRPTAHVRLEAILEVVLLDL